VRGLELGGFEIESPAAGWECRRGARGRVRLGLGTGLRYGKRDFDYIKQPFSAMRKLPCVIYLSANGSDSWLSLEDACFDLMNLGLNATNLDPNSSRLQSSAMR